MSLRMDWPGEALIQVPTDEECLRLISEMDMMDHIQAHSRQVCRVAEFLTVSIDGRGGRLNRTLVRMSALLHDITKTRSFRTNESHAATGGELLTRLGYPAVGAIIAQHVRLDRYDEDGPVREEEIVNYADKRVLDDRIVSLDARMGYILDRYGTEPEYRTFIIALCGQTKTLENKLFRHLPFRPEELSGRLNGAVASPPG